MTKKSPKSKKTPVQTSDKKENIQELTLEQEIRQSLNEGTAGQHKKALFKKRMKYTMIIGGILLCVWLYNWLFAWGKGDMRYAVCKTFIELYVRNPHELRYSKVEKFGPMTRIYYVDHNSYGERMLRSMDCYYERREDGRMQLEKVELDRRELNPKIVKSFNKSISSIFAYPPDLTLPRGLPDGLSELHLNKK